VKKSSIITQKGSSFFYKNSVALVLIVIIVIFSLTTDTFFTFENLQLVLRQSTLVGMLAIGLSYVAIVGKIDFSIGAIVSLTTTVAVKVHEQLGPGPAVLIGLLVGAAFGAINGFLIGYMGLNALITTLGMQNIITSTSLIYTKNQYLSLQTESWFKKISHGMIVSGVSVQLVIYVVLLFLMQFVLSKTLLGSQVKAVGNSAICSDYSGISSKRTIWIAYIISGTFAAGAGIMLASRSGVGTFDAGTGMEFSALSAVVLGGTSLLGGKGSILKGCVGVLISSTMKNGFIMIGLNDYVQWIVQSIIILSATIIDVSSRRERKEI
jgi:Ribose/xylose/arabinose/galactoside ABC-type transport systems, permease components